VAEAGVPLRGRQRRPATASASKADGAPPVSSVSWLTLATKSRRVASSRTMSEVSLGGPPRRTRRPAGRTWPSTRLRAGGPRCSSGDQVDLQARRPVAMACFGCLQRPGDRALANPGPGPISVAPRVVQHHVAVPVEHGQATARGTARPGAAGRRRVGPTGRGRPGPAPPEPTAPPTVSPHQQGCQRPGAIARQGRSQQHRRQLPGGPLTRPETPER